MIVVMAGLPGTGKTTLASALAKSIGGILLNKDCLRAALFSAPFVAYSSEQDDFVQDLMQRTAEYLLIRRPQLTVFFDGRTFSKRYQVERVIAMAKKIGSPWRIIECVCAEDIARERIENAGLHPAANRTFELYRRIRDQFEEIEHPKMVIDTGGERQMNFDAALAYVSNEIGRR